MTGQTVERRLPQGVSWESWVLALVYGGAVLTFVFAPVENGMPLLDLWLNAGEPQPDHAGWVPSAPIWKTVMLGIPLVLSIVFIVARTKEWLFATAAVAIVVFAIIWGMPAPEAGA